MWLTMLWNNNPVKIHIDWLFKTQPRHSNVPTSSTKSALTGKACYRQFVWILLAAGATLHATLGGPRRMGENMA
jgi:hypothetical protein